MRVSGLWAILMVSLLSSRIDAAQFCPIVDLWEVTPASGSSPAVWEWLGDVYNDPVVMDGRCGEYMGPGTLPGTDFTPYSECELDSGPCIRFISDPFQYNTPRAGYPGGRRLIGQDFPCSTPGRVNVLRRFVSNVAIGESGSVVAVEFFECEFKRAEPPKYPIGCRPPTFIVGFEVRPPLTPIPGPTLRSQALDIGGHRYHTDIPGHCAKALVLLVDSNEQVQPGTAEPTPTPAAASAGTCCRQTAAPTVVHAVKAPRRGIRGAGLFRRGR